MDTQSASMSPADFAAMFNNGNEWGNGCWWVIIIFLLIFGWGGNGAFGNNGNNAFDAAIAAQGGYVTNSQLNDSLRLQTLQQGQRDIVDNVNSNKYDIVTNTNAVESRLTANLASLLANQAANAQAQQACCADVKYNSAMNTASINENTAVLVQKVLDRLSEQENQRLRDENANLHNQLNMAGVVRYPMATTYNSGMNPFCSCGCTNI